jgi:chromosome segregation ATPase
LEAQVDALTTEKSSLQAALDAAQAESQRLSLEDTRTKEEWDEERRKIIDEAAAQLVAKEVEVKSLNNTIEELKEELERVRSSEQELIAQSLSASLDTEAKIAEVTAEIHTTASLEKEGLEKQLLEAQTSLDAKDRALKELESHSSGLKDQLASAEAEVRRLKEAKAVLETEKAKRQVEAIPMPTKPTGGWFSLSGWCKSVTSWLTYGYVVSMADESARYGLSRHPSCIYLA